MGSILIKNCRLVNEGIIKTQDVLIKDGLIDKIAQSISSGQASKTIDGSGSLLLPGIIDDQVHFREPGLTHKGTIYSEARAAVAGGVTSFMEMPNTIPNALTQQLLEEKYKLASRTSLANYSFFMGASNDNFEEVMRTDIKNVCGIKIFMGSSTGNMLVDKAEVLENIFREAPMLIAVHCEDEALIQTNLKVYKEKYGENAPAEVHAEIRNETACFRSSSFAVDLARQYNTRLHVLHISTQKELALFQNTLSLSEKKITAEVCIHHLWFDATNYATLGNLIKWNPAIKDSHHKLALMEALLNNTLDIIATDHAPHTWEEKQNNYWQAPSGGPMVQHSLNIMLEFYAQGKITLEKIVEKMCHAPAVCFQIDRRGFIREGYYADLTIVDLEKNWTVDKNNLHYKCGWSALEGQRFQGKVTHTIVSGQLAYDNGVFAEQSCGQRLVFKR